MSKTRVGIIGLGGVSQVVHLPILSKLSNVEIAAVCDTDKNKLNAISEKYRISNSYLNYNELLQRDDIEAVIVATPTNTHHKIVIDSVNASKHVLVEKPASITSGEAEDMAKASKAAKVKLLVGMNLRFRPDAMLLKSLINSGELGNIFYVKCGWLRKQSSNEKWFIQKQKAGGGVLADLGILLIDMALWLVDFPKVNTISVQKYSHNTKAVEDSAVGLLRAGKEIAINFDVSWSMMSEESTFGLSVFGTEGTAKLNPLRALKKVGSSNIDYSPSVSSGTKSLFKKSYENELKHFIACVRSGTEVISSIDDAVHRMSLIEKIYESAEKNIEIKL